VFSLGQRLRAISIVAALVACADRASGTEAPLKDPMQPYRHVDTSDIHGAPAQRYALSTVLISATRRVAVINGTLLREGDRIDGAEVVRIASQRVELRRGGETFVVGLKLRADK
jgi:MSHA biogenesis protein MshK